MPFSRPTLQTLIQRTAAEVASRMNLGPLLPRSVQYILSRVVAGQSHLAHGHIAWAARQILPDTAEAEFLERWANVWGVLRKEATKATGEITITGNGTPTVPAGTEFQRDDGVKFTTDTSVQLSGGTATDVAITAVTAAAAANTDAGVQLTLTSAIPNVDSVATIEADGNGLGLTGGNDAESDANLLARLLKRIQQPPHGGAHADYELWALEVAGVTRAWCLDLWLGAGTVGVAFVRDDDAPGSIIPDAAEIAVVQAYLDDEERRPVTATVYAIGPTPVNLNPDVTLTPSGDADVEAAVTAALTDLLTREATVATTGFTSTLPISRIREAISTATGERDHILNSPTGDVTTQPGELLVLGTPVYS